MESLSIQLTEKEVKKIKELAQKESRSISGQVRHLIRKALGMIK